MSELRYTLVSDGSSDKALIPVLDWLIRQSGYNGDFEGECCDFRLFRRREGSNVLAAKIRYGLRLYPCDILFVHRDAERASRAKRLQEIKDALAEVFPGSQGKTWVPVVPVRMTEAWLLFDEPAIRRAAGNPHGTEALGMPDLRTLERVPHPEELLRTVIVQATGLNARRLENFNIGRSILEITQHVHDFSRLRGLKAFVRLESDIRQLFMNPGPP